MIPEKLILDVFDRSWRGPWDRFGVILEFMLPSKITKFHNGFSSVLGALMAALGLSKYLPKSPSKPHQHSMVFYRFP